MDKVEKIMTILNNELNMEIACYQQSLGMMKKTHNPIKKLECKKALDMFEAHIAALKRTIICINLALEEDEG